MKPIILIIIDGYGLSDSLEGNALNLDFTPNLKKLLKPGSFAKLKACGGAVGLPEGQMGNSEVGHLTLGVGRVVNSEQTKISMAIKTGEFFKNPELIRALENCKKNSSTLHLMGLVSDGGVHSQLSHLFAILKMAQRYGLKKINLHVFLDGRDTPPQSGVFFVKRLEERLKEINGSKLCTLMGRYFAMDRDNREERTQEAFEAIAFGLGAAPEEPPEVALKEEYKRGRTDEFIKPLIFKKEDISSADSVIFFNFRADRARQLTQKFLAKYPEICFVCMTDYGVENARVAFGKTQVKNGFSQWVSSLGFRQLKVAETEKYAHVTYFFNGGIDRAFEGEDRILVPSPKVKTYDEKPEMSAFEVTNALLGRLDAQKFEFAVVNYANCDMVGHTGRFAPAVKAAEAVDECVGRVMKKAQELGAQVVITADHGNAEKMEDSRGELFTAHTCNLVPFVFAKPGIKLKKEGELQDVVPTVFDFLGLPKPTEMEGHSLLC